MGPLQNILGSTISTEIVWNSKAINTVLHQFLTRQCASWTSWALLCDGQVTTRIIEVSELDDELTSIDRWLREKADCDDTPVQHRATLDELVDWFVETYNFPLLLETLESKAKALSTVGYTDAADELIVRLGLTENSHKSIKLTSKGLVVDFNVYPCQIMGRYDYNTRSSCMKLAGLLAEAEAGMGISGLSSSFAALGEELERDRSPRASRETFSPEDGSIVFSYFKEKIKATIPTQHVAPLIAFLKAYSTKAMRNDL
jgi:hypothetical protein